MIESTNKDLERINREIAKEQQTKKTITVEGVFGEILAGEWIPLPLPTQVVTESQISSIALKLSRRGLGYSKAVIILSAILQAQKRAA